MKKLLLIFTIIICGSFATKAQSLNKLIINELDCQLRYDIYLNDANCSVYFYTSVIAGPGQPITFNIPPYTEVNFIKISTNMGCEEEPNFPVGNNCVHCNSRYDYEQTYDLPCCGTVTFLWEDCDTFRAYHS